MPKTEGTRKQRAEELYKRIVECSFSPSFEPFNEVPTDKEIKSRVKNWLHSWILPEVIDLIPELKDKKNNLNGYISV